LQLELKATNLLSFTHVEAEVENLEQGGTYYLAEAGVTTHLTDALNVSVIYL
jgi:hypothetical protein